MPFTGVSEFVSILYNRQSVSIDLRVLIVILSSVISFRLDYSQALGGLKCVRFYFDGI